MMQEVLPLLVFQTDFTYMEGAVASMYGVVRSVSRDVEIITATHDLPQYDIWSASYRLQQYVEFWPKGTVFVSVVDPGVGTERKACAACTEDGYYIITPDNGSFGSTALPRCVRSTRRSTVWLRPEAHRYSTAAICSATAPRSWHPERSPLKKSVRHIRYRRS